MSAAIDRLLGKLKGVRGPDGRWTARCPAHDDQHASLSVGIGDDGRALVHCHVGCTTDAILEAIGMTRADLFERENGRGSGRLEITDTYPYTDAAGTLLYEIVRFVPKTFRPRRPGGNGGFVWNLEGVPRVLYKLREIQGRKTVLLVEGEKDANALWRIGVPGSTNCGGASEKKWRPEYVQQLKDAGVECVGVIPDLDPPGETHARIVARSLHDAGFFVKLIHLPGLEAKGADVSDWLAAGHTKDELRDAVHRAPPFDPARSVAAAPKLELTSLADLLSEPDTAIDWVVEDRIPAGGVTLLAGPPKLAGKSTATRCLSLAVAQGERWLGWRTTFGPVWYLAFEDARSEIRRHFRQMGARGDEPIRILAGQAPSEILPMLHDLAAAERPRLICVDTLGRLLKAKDFSDYAEITAKFDPLLRLARDTGAALLLLTHASSHSQRQGLDAVLGSTAIAASVDNVLVLSATHTLTSTQRIGPSLTDPIVVGLDAQTGRVFVEGHKRELDDRDLAARILAALRDHGEPVRENWIKDAQNVEGRGADKVRLVRVLLSQGKLRRFGAGGHREPYTYAVADDTMSRPVSGSQESDETADLGNLMPDDESPVNPALDFERPFEVPEVPGVRTYKRGNLQEPTTDDLQVPEVPEVPDLSENDDSEHHEDVKHPHETESVRGSREPGEDDDAYE